MSAATPEETLSPPTGTEAEAGPVVTARPGGRWHRRGLTSAISTASVIVVLAAWQLCASQGVVDQKLTSSPWGVVQAARFLIDSGQLGPEVASSAKLFGVGLGLAIVIGALGGVLIGWWRLVAAVFEPWIAILYAMPLIALLPLILVWFGIGFTAEVVMVVLISVFPVLVSVMTGTRNVDQQLVRLARSFCGSELAIIRTVLLPSLIPYFVAGVRLAIGSALVGVVVSEYFLGNGGIGGLIVTAGENLQSGEVFVGITILALSAIVMTGLLRRAERRFSQWRDR
jgi:ABC-type nitrate/sulfonate/bicarbonate transport system permease component